MNSSRHPKSKGACDGVYAIQGASRMSERPEYVKCIEDKPSLGWCGELIPPGDWAFTSIEHAIRTVRKGERLIPCPHCMVAVLEALNEVIKQSAPWRE